MLGVYRVVDQNAIYTFTKRGVFYFSRRVPKSLRPRFDKLRIIACLHTRSAAQPRKKDKPMQSRMPMHPSPRCCARTRQGTSCQSPAMPNGRCRMRGGKNPAAPNGNQHAFKHGRFTAQAICDRRMISALVRGRRMVAELGE
ncbi:DUF6538 domain-containing protein [Bosea thiooxidans]